MLQRNARRRRVQPALETVPIWGFSDQFTALFDWLVTVAVSCWVWVAVKVVVRGDIVIFPCAMLMEPTAKAL